MSTNIGVLVVNLGSPDSTQVHDVKKYLNEFLMDEKVLDIPYWKRFLLVKGIILNTRPKKSAAAYRRIWWKEGSPLVVLSKRVLEKLRRRLPMPVELAMRYGNPSIEYGIDKLLATGRGLQKMYVIPQYPHYAMSSYETVVEKVKAYCEVNYPQIEVKFKEPFFDESAYISVLANSIKEALPEHYDHLLFSYHGIPERHVKKSDPTGSHCLCAENCCQTPSEAHATCYRHQVYKTTELVTTELGIPPERYSVSFQSRLLNDPWLSPYTDKTIENLAESGIKSLVVVCPAFVTDCLETLEEIEMEGKHAFEEAGGEYYRMIPCLNDRDDWVDLQAQWVVNNE